MTLSFNSPKLNHALALVDLYIRLSQSNLGAFDYEPIQTYYKGTQALKYAPDAFIIYERKSYVVEVQLKALSRKEWERKWSKGANVYFNRDRKHYEGATWNNYASAPFIPHVLVVSSQPLEIVSTGFDVQKRTINIMPPV